MSDLTILVVDDNELFRTEVVGFLKRRGFTVSEAKTGDHGLRLARRSAPDIIITDLVMPDMDGIEEIKQLRAELPKTKIFAMSGGARRRNFDLLKLAGKIGADALFEKPLNMKSVLDAIATVCPRPTPMEDPAV